MVPATKANNPHMEVFLVNIGGIALGLLRFKSAASIGGKATRIKGIKIWNDLSPLPKRG